MSDDVAPEMYWHGRKWDAPLTDDAMPMSLDMLDHWLGRLCTLCQEPMLGEENLFLTRYMQTHLECNVRSGMGDVAHLEGRCSCPVNGTVAADRHTQEELDQSYREASLATVQWLIDHHRGRFHD